LHYIPVYRQPYYETLGFGPGYCPEAEHYFREAISIAMYPGLSEEQQIKVIETLLNLVA
jgi:dTDP-4-amino-4,6-dideoxygalactose transaminase